MRNGRPRREREEAFWVLRTFLRSADRGGCSLVCGCCEGEILFVLFRSSHRRTVASSHRRRSPTRIRRDSGDMTTTTTPRRSAAPKMKRPRLSGVARAATRRGTFCGSATGHSPQNRRGQSEERGESSKSATIINAESAHIHIHYYQSWPETSFPFKSAHGSSSETRCSPESSS